MGDPYTIATLLYCFNEANEILLLERKREPNLGFWSPCGGKVNMSSGESPYGCACREAEEELGLKVTAADLHLTGIVSEEAYSGEAHWLMFLFELKPKLKAVPSEHAEGHFQFFNREKLAVLKIPQTDREMIWPLFWKFRGGFFAAHCKTQPNGQNIWTVEESWSVSHV